MNGILGNMQNWMTPDRADSLSALGLGLSQMSSGQAVNLAPMRLAMEQRKRRDAMKQSIAPALESLPPEMRSVLASMPPELASQYILKQMEPRAPTRGVVINGRLVDPVSGELIADYSAGTGADANEYGLTPQYLVDGQGNIQMLQLSKDGTSKVVDVPEGFEVSKGLEKVDQGTHWQWVNKFTGEAVGQPFPKNNAAASGETEAGKQGIKMAGDAWASYGQMQRANGNIQSAIDALDAGARSGAVDRFLPNITTASAQLETAMNQMGLDVISAVTFGALSEKELRLAMETAVPRNLDEADLRQWLVEKQEANAKAAEMLADAAEFLSVPGNTLDKWIAKNRGESSAAAPSAANDKDPLGLFE